MTQKKLPGIADARQTRGRRKWTDLEGPVHRECLEAARLLLPGAVIHHSPNAFGASGPEIARQIAKHKSMGMVPGYPDLIVHWRKFTFGLEVKAGSNGLSPDQRDVEAAFSANGIPYAVVRSAGDVIDWIKSNLPPEIAPYATRIKR